MKHIQKGNVPAFFTDFMKKEKPKEWADTAPIRPQLREYILEHEQQGCCAYTEIRISGDKACHIDHYHTRNLFPNETFNYDNLLVSCNAENYGAKYKDKQVKVKADYDKLLNPATDVPSAYLEYTFMGEMLAIGGNERGAHTIEYFNLNERSLVNRRRNAVYCLQGMKNDLSEDEVVEAIGEFETMLRQLYKQL